jgi:type IV pilus assembly protein PilC
MELSMLTKSGVMPADALTMLLEDEHSREGKEVLQSLYDKVLKGAALSASFRDSGFFPDYMISMTEFGEKTGRTVEALEALSEYYERRDRLNVSIRNALIYPTTLAIMMFAAMLILIIYVLPVFNDVFSMMGSQMPPFAVALMSIGTWLEGASAVIAVILVALALFALVLWVMPGLRGSIIGSLKNVWGGSKLFTKISASRFTSVMALSVKSGLDMEESVKLASNVSGGTKASDARNSECLRLLKQGKNLPEAMGESGILSGKDARMLAVGFKSGRTDDAISEIARRNDVGAQDDIARVVGRIEPVLVIVTSVIVGVVLLSVMLPLISIMRIIG